jgi:hypothetical protein
MRIERTAISLAEDRVVELEQGATHLPEGQTPGRALRADDVGYHWFRFRCPSRH